MPISRREALLAGGAGLLAGTTTARAAPAPAPAGRPNILFILADDLGYADLSCFGQPLFKTPRLDTLAAGGLMIMQAYANSAVCSASRTALLTGRYQYRLPIGLQEPVGGPPGNTLFVPPDHPTIASLLKGRGYRTSLIGKWHLGQYPDHSPRHSGYDYCFGFVGGADDYFTHSGPDKRPANGLWENDTPVDRPGYLTDILAERAIHEIGVATGAKTPFFMSLHFNAPHWPWEGPGDLAHARAVTNLRDNDSGSVQKYAEMVQAMDAAIGRVLDAVQASGQAHNTIVVFTSDNGGERFSDVWPFVGMKGELMEGGIRIPAIVRWPARVRPGGRTQQVMAHMDWLPTLLAAAGGAPDPRYPSDGENLLPVLLGQAPVRPRKLYWRYKAAEQAALRDGDWKYLRLAGKDWLFDVVQDQHERADLKAKRPEVLARLKADWTQWNSAMLPYPDGVTSDNPKAVGTFVDRY